MGFGDKMALGPYTLLCRSYTQEENPNYSSDLAIIQIFKGDKQIDTLYPESRFYTASQQQQTMPRISNRLEPFWQGSLRRLRRPESGYRPPHH